MDFETLQKMTSKLPIPTPDENAKNAAISAGLSAFTEIQQKKNESIQGTHKEARPIGVIQLSHTFLRRLTMKKIYAFTGGLSMAAVAALLLSSTSLYKQVVPIPPEQTALITDMKKEPLASVPEVLNNVQVALPDTGNAIADSEKIVDKSKKAEPAKPALVEEPVAILAPQEKAPGKGDLREASKEGLLAYKKEKPKQDEMKQEYGARTDDIARLNKSKDGLKNGDFERAEADAIQPAPSAPSTTSMSAPAYAPKLAAGRASSTLRDGKAAPAAEKVVSNNAPVDSVYYQGYHDEGRDKFEDIKENPNKITKEEPVSTFSVDVDTASYSFVRGELNRGELPQKDAVRVEEMINYFDYDYAQPASKDEPFQPNVAVYPTPWNANTKIMQIGVKGYDIKSTEKPRANLTFLIDVSGSMNEPNKLPLLKQSMRMLVNELKPDDTVAMVVYAGSAGTALEPTKVKNKQAILSAIDNLEAGGSTAGGEGINLAYKLAEQNFDKEGVNRVILATDGDFNVGITDTEELKSFIVKKRDTGVTLSVLGFGEGNYNDELMQKLAQNGNGNASYIDTVNEARKVLVNEAGSTLFTIAKDVKIQVEFNPAEVSEYRLIGYTTRILNREDFNNDKVDAGDIGAGHKVTALYEITPKGAKGSVDPLRYGAAPEEEAKPAATSNGEYAFLKIRYKLPTGTTSKLMTRAIMPSDDVKDAANVPSNLGFAVAVAAFGQKLAGDAHVGDFKYDDILTLAKSTRGEDEFGYRTEFMQLVRTAKSLAGESGGLDKPIE